MGGALGVGNVQIATISVPASRPRPHRRRWPARPDLGLRWSSGLSATAAEDRLRRPSRGTLTSDASVVA
jgi:hypothetical protein